MIDTKFISQVVDKAVPLKTEIDLVHKGEYKDLFEKFMDVTGASKKITTNVPNTGIENNKSMSSIFKMVVDCLVTSGGDLTKENKHGLIERKIQDIGWIVYIFDRAGLDTELQQVYKHFGVVDIKIDYAHYDAYFDKALSVNTLLLRDILLDAAATVKTTHGIEETIKTEMFDSLGANVYDKEKNPLGIKQSAFVTMVKCKANDDVEKQKEKQIQRQQDIAESADSFVELLKEIV